MSNSTIPSEARATTKYTLSPATRPQKRSLRESGRKLVLLLATEKKPFIAAVGAIVFSSIATLVAPIVIVRAIDTDVRLKNMHGLLISSLFVLAIYITGSVASYIQVI